jgi:hypothetical protein
MIKADEEIFLGSERITKFYFFVLLSVFRL